MDNKINISMTKKDYHNGDALDFNLRTLDIFHAHELNLGVAQLFDCGIVNSEDHVCGQGIQGRTYYDRRNLNEVAEIKYGGTLALTDYGRENVRRQISFYPELIEIDGKQYAVLKCGLHLILRCPGIIWHDGAWCAPMDQLEYHDNAVWCASVYDD